MYSCGFSTKGLIRETHYWPVLTQFHITVLFSSKSWDPELCRLLEMEDIFKIFKYHGERWRGYEIKSTKNDRSVRIIRILEYGTHEMNVLLATNL